MATIFDNETAQALNEAAGLLTDEGLNDEAVACLTRGIFLEPDNGYLWFNLALVYRKQNKRSESIQALQEALNLIHDDADIWDTIGVSLFELGEFEGSSIAFSNAFKHDNKSSRIWNNYGTLLFNQKKYIEARNAFETALVLDAKNVDAFLNLYDTYVELGEKDKLKECNSILDSMNYVVHQ
ncbi:MAG: tetratricopeptide repeat protein [Spirochaetaceae bacterium]|nr:tetratricopeptide repeat protein [Spirochaetaceae bacterium]